MSEQFLWTQKRRFESVNVGVGVIMNVSRLYIDMNEYLSIYMYMCVCVYFCA